MLKHTPKLTDCQHGKEYFMDKHTKTPWRYKEGSIISNGNEYVSGQDNAAFIVKAVNSHDELVEAVESLLVEAEVSLEHMDEADEKFACSERIKWAKQVLRKAGEHA